MKQFTLILIAVFIFSACSKQSKNAEAVASNVSSSSQSKNSFEANGSVKFANNVFYEAAAAKSAVVTFGAGSTATIKKVETSTFPEGTIQTVYYTNQKGQESTFTVIENNVLQVKVTVDCYGSCDCRERLILDPSGNPKSYECTCDRCKMDVVTTPN